MKKYIKRGDLWIIIAVLLVSGFIYVPLLLRGSGKIAEILVDGTVTDRIDLQQVTEEYIMKIQGSEILVGPGRIGYLHSDCPNGDCVRFGMLSRAGSTAACIPNHTMIRILSGSGQQKGPDAVTY